MARYLIRKPPISHDDLVDKINKDHYRQMYGKEILTENDMEKLRQEVLYGKVDDMKTGFWSGLLEGIAMQTLWDEETGEAKKDRSYFSGNLVATIIFPLAGIGLLTDISRDKYQL